MITLFLRLVAEHDCLRCSLRALKNHRSTEQAVSIAVLVVCLGRGVRAFSIGADIIM